MKQIKVLVGGQVHVSTTGTNLSEAMSLSKEARRNKAKVLDGALTIEHELAAILSYYFSGRSHERKAIFEALVLNSDWCSFAAKRKDRTRHRRAAAFEWEGQERLREAAAPYHVPA